MVTKGSNAVLSFMDHFLNTFGLGEERVNFTVIIGLDKIRTGMLLQV